MILKEVWTLYIEYQGLLFHSILKKGNIICDITNFCLFEPLTFSETFEQGVGDFMNKGNVKSGPYIYNNFEKGICVGKNWSFVWVNPYMVDEFY